MEKHSSITVLQKEYFKGQAGKKVTFSFSFHTEVLKSHSAFPNQEFSFLEYFCFISLKCKTLVKCV